MGDVEGVKRARQKMDAVITVLWKITVIMLLASIGFRLVLAMLGDWEAAWRDLGVPLFVAILLWGRKYHAQ